MVDVGRDITAFSQVFADAGFTSGQVVFMGSAGVLTKDADFLYDPSTKALTVGGLVQFKAGTAFKGIFTHANSADRTYTLPNASGTVVVGGAGSGVVVNSDISAGAAIAYSKLALTNSIVNADIASAAAIAKSKISSTGTWTDAEIPTTLTGHTISGGTFSGTIAGTPTISGAWTWSVAQTFPGLTLTGAVNFGGFTATNFAASAPSFTGLVTSAGNILFDNGIALRWKDSGATARNVLYLNSGNSVLLLNDAAGALVFQTDNASGAGNPTARLTITGNATQATATFSATDVSVGTNKLSTDLYDIQRGVVNGLYLQVSRANASSYLATVGTTPGTHEARFIAWIGDATNFESFVLGYSVSLSKMFIQSTKGGTGTLRPIAFLMSASEILTFNTDNTVNANSRTWNNFVAASPDFTGTVDFGSSSIIGTPTISNIWTWSGTVNDYLLKITNTNSSGSAGGLSMSGLVGGNPAIAINSYNGYSTRGTVNIDGDTEQTIYLDTYNASLVSGVVGRRARGTKAAPTAVQNNDNIMALVARGYGSTGFASGNRAAILLKAAENWTDTAQGTYITLETTAIGSTTRTVAVTIGADNTVTFSGNASIGANKVQTTNYDVFETSGNTRINHRTSNAILELLPGGSGTSQFWINKVSDTVNYERMILQNGASFHLINIVQGGTGSLRALKIQMGGNDIFTFNTDNSVNFNSRAISNVLLGSNLDAGSNRLTKVASLHFDPTNTDLDSNIMGSRSNNLSFASTADGATARQIVFRTPTVITAGTGTPASRLVLNAGSALGSAGIDIRETLYFTQNATGFAYAAQAAITADASAGNLILNAPSTKNITARINGTAVFTVASAAVTIAEATDVVVGTTTGTKIATATTQKIAFFGSTPIVQPSATGETVGFTAGAGTNVTDQSTFTGNVGATAYRISDLVKHLKNLGLIAA